MLRRPSWRHMTLKVGPIHPPALSLPLWPSQDLDITGASHLIVQVGPTVDATTERVALARSHAPTTLLNLPAYDAAGAETLKATLRLSRVGLRVMVIGGQYDVLQALAECRASGVLPPELRAIVTHTRDLPVFCAHCRTTSRICAVTGGEATCPGCSRRVEIHSHTSEIRGSFLASAIAA